MGRNRVYENTREDETTQRVKTGSDIKSPIDRIEESYPHHLDFIQQGHFDDIYDASQSHEVRPRQQVQLRDTDTTIVSVKKSSGMLMTLAKAIVQNLINFLGDPYIITHFVNKA